MEGTGLHALLANLGPRPKPDQFVVLHSNIIQVMSTVYDSPNYLSLWVISPSIKVT